MLKFFFCLSLLIGSNVSFGATEQWDCSRITLKEFKFAKDCPTKGTQSANDKRSKDIQENKKCSIVVDVAGKEKVLNFLVPSPYWRDDIGFSWQCENAKGKSLRELPENCSISLNQGNEEMGKRVRCECSKIGCGQSLIRIKGTDQKDIKEKLQSSIKGLSASCDDLTFGGSATANNETKIYASSLKCPLAELGPHYNCPSSSSPRNLSYNDQRVAVVCIPTATSGSSSGQGTAEGVR